MITNEQSPTEANGLSMQAAPYRLAVLLVRSLKPLFLGEGTQKPKVQVRTNRWMHGTDNHHIRLGLTNISYHTILSEK
jgi:hypothetical protein